MKCTLVKVTFDERVDILTIRLRDGHYEESDEVTEGIVLDFDNAGKVMGIEILDASKVLKRADLEILEYVRLTQTL